jgi:hypothetical protein
VVFFDFLQSDWLQQRAAFYDILTVAQNKKVQQKCNSSKYLSAFLQAIRHQSRHPG